IREYQIGEKLDPLIPNVSLGLCYYFARRYDDALHQLSITREMHPDLVAIRPLLGDAFAAKGEFQPALKEYDAAKAGQLGTGVDTRLILTLVRMGRRDEALKLLKQIERGNHPPDALDLAAIYGALGDKEHAFALLDRAFEKGNVWFLKV